ncbi:MAG: hypothetical protein [Caudoviricetes sp.]|nr:MAG: hypothetical protein [Caudoviricetes sp.]
MKYSELVESLVGTYVAVTFSKESLDMFERLQRKLNLEKKTPTDKMHSTILFSRKKIDFPVLSDVYETASKKVQYQVFETQTGKRALVLLLDSEYLTHRHNLGMSLGATYDYPEYHPHVTLSYDIGDMEVSTKPFNLATEPVIVAEYMEDLDLTWSDQDD